VTVRSVGQCEANLSSPVFLVLFSIVRLRNG